MNSTATCNVLTRTGKNSLKITISPSFIYIGMQYRVTTIITYKFTLQKYHDVKGHMPLLHAEMMCKTATGLRFIQLGLREEKKKYSRKFRQKGFVEGRNEKKKKETLQASTKRRDEWI